MSDANLNAIVARIKRFISDTVVSGTYSDEELEYYAQDAAGWIPTDYPSFEDYTITISSGISPAPSHFDSILLSLKAASLAYNATIQESVADAIMVRVGSIALDTSKSLRAKGLEGNRLEAMYDKLIKELVIDISAASTLGYRIDNYITVESEENQEDSDSLI